MKYKPYETIKNEELTETMVYVTGSDCFKCEEEEKEQNFSVTDSYGDDGVGAYPIIYCHSCNEYRESGDSDFHKYFKIGKDEHGWTINPREEEDY